MGKVIVQMAGIRTAQEAVKCAEAGCEIIGLLVGQKHVSDDFLTVPQAKEIANSVRGRAKLTLITHLENADEIIEIAKSIRVDFLQLHSNIAESEVEKIRKALPDVKLIRIVHISQDGEILTDISRIRLVDFFFTDSINLQTNQVGGTGLVHDYNTDKRLRETLKKPLFLAGGLTPENVADAVRLVRPFAVDVNSGCKAKRGGRDMKKVVSFVKNAKSVEL